MLSGKTYHRRDAETRRQNEVAEVRSDPRFETQPEEIAGERSQKASASQRLGGKGVRGFTFVELMVVITIIVILITMAIPIYNKTILRSKEAVLRTNLNTLRTVIDNYTYDKMKAPHGLDDLVHEGYLRTIPTDPMTGSSDTWKTVMEDPGQSVDQNDPGLWDVHSGSDKISLEGTPYSDW